MLIYSVVFPNVDVYTNSINLNSDYNIDYKVYNLFTNLTNKSSIIENNINSSNVGTYTIVINVKYLFFNVNKTVDINVIDNTKPIITLMVIQKLRFVQIPIITKKDIPRVIITTEILQKE